METTNQTLVNLATQAFALESRLVGSDMERWNAEPHYRDALRWFPGLDESAFYTAFWAAALTAELGATIANRLLTR